MSLTTFGKNKQANAINYDKASIHTGDPGNNGAANEVRALTPDEIANGETPYARQTVTLAAAVNGVRQANEQPVFSIPAGETVTHYALWEGVNCVDTGLLPNAESYGGFGSYTLENIESNNT